MMKKKMPMKITLFYEDILKYKENLHLKIPNIVFFSLTF